MYNEGISREGDVIDLAANHDVVVKSGAWYEYEGQKIAQGREAAKQYLKDNPKVFEKVTAATRAAAEKTE
jgi:recombination protein RecA